MNKRNYSQRSNYLCGTNVLNLLPFYAQTINIPGLNFSLPEIGGRNGARISLSSDGVVFNTLSIDMIMDEDYQLYKDINKIIFDHLNVETGTFVEFTFDFWCEVTDDLGKSVMKIEYYNCRIESIGDLSLDTMDDSTEHTMNMEIKFDYFKLIDQNNIPSLRI